MKGLRGDLRDVTVLYSIGGRVNGARGSIVRKKSAGGPGGLSRDFGQEQDASSPLFSMIQLGEEERDSEGEPVLSREWLGLWAKTSCLGGGRKENWNG